MKVNDCTPPKTQTSRDRLQPPTTPNRNMWRMIDERKIIITFTLLTSKAKVLILSIYPSNKCKSFGANNTNINALRLIGIIMNRNVINQSKAFRLPHMLTCTQILYQQHSTNRFPLAVFNTRP